jgi:hypothetical protein
MLREHGLYAKLEKCEFDKSSMAFLGYVISPDGIFMDKSKVETIQCWATPSSVKDVQRFLGFANFYRRFIKGYSKIATPFITLTCKDKPFSWNPTTQAAFDTLKMTFTSPPQNRWTNRTDKPDIRAIPSLHCELPTRRLAGLTI